MMTVKISVDGTVYEYEFPNGTTQAEIVDAITKGVKVIGGRPRRD